MEKIKVTESVDTFDNEVVLGDLTKKQYAALCKAAQLSPGYWFEVVRYNGGPSSHAVHVNIWSDKIEGESVGLVSHEGFQFYDKSKRTYAVCRRVAQRVYHKNFWIENTAEEALR
jgi:hypothetical protein